MRVYTEAQRRRNLVYIAGYRAIERDLEFTLTTEWIDEVWPADNRCPVLDIPLKWGEYKSGRSPSIDKINPAGGHTPDNCRIISWRANRLKSDATPEELILLAKDATNNAHNSSSRYGREGHPA